jgi:3-methyladenine DNA glycosylase/8-oxoguanine DNA glycosylase
MPSGPYSLALSARGAGDATRSFREGRLDAVVLARAEGGPASARPTPARPAGASPAGATPERATAWQRPDGAVVLRAETEAGLAALRCQLALDDDHTPFLERFAGDPLLGPSLRELRGLRQLRVGSVAQSLLRALCGQLIQAGQARAIERAVVRAVAPRVGDLCAPPTSVQLAALAPARLRALGLHARRGATLVRVCAALDLERLHAHDTAAVAARLERERGLGPWSVGVICLEGLGRSERGLVGDLGLVVLLGRLLGRRVEAHETTLLLDRYGEWAGLASVYLLAGSRRGLVPTGTGLPAAA